MKRLPLEARLAVFLVGGSALVFLLIALVRLADDPRAIRFPIVVTIAAALCVASLIARIRFARKVSLVVITLLCLAHFSIALGDLPWWARIASGVFAVAHAYAFVLLMTKPAFEYYEVRRA